MIRVIRIVSLVYGIRWCWFQRLPVRLPYPKLSGDALTTFFFRMLGAWLFYGCWEAFGKGLGRIRGTRNTKIHICRETVRLRMYSVWLDMHVHLCSLARGEEAYTVLCTCQPTVQFPTLVASHTNSNHNASFCCLPLLLVPICLAASPLEVRLCSAAPLIGCIPRGSSLSCSLSSGSVPRG